jgi:hypothetical protein
MRLLITEVTEMHGGNFCVAGWCAATQTMIRPLPNGANWTQGLLAAHGVAPGVTIDVSPSGAPANGVFPHLTEDTPIDPASIVLAMPGPFNWFGQSAPASSGFVGQAFQGFVQSNSVWQGVHQGVHVPAGSLTRSLWAVVIPRANLSFVEEFDKLKASVFDGATMFKVAVSSRELKQAWRGGGLPALNQLLPAAGALHVRLGLARAFGTPADKCYMMVNGVQW